MNLEEMLKTLEAEAKEKTDSILAEAGVQANQILEQARDLGNKLAAHSLAQSKQRLLLEKAKLLSAARFDSKKEVLMAKEKVVNALFEQLTDLAKKDLRLDEQLFKVYADEALLKFKDQKVKIFVNKENKQIAEKVLNGAASNYQIDDSLKCIGGIKVASEDGRITIDNTIDGRINKIRHIFEPEIIKSMFGEEN